VVLAAQHRRFPSTEAAPGYSRRAAVSPEPARMHNLGLGSTLQVVAVAHDGPISAACATEAGWATVA